MFFFIYLLGGVLTIMRYVNVDHKLLAGAIYDLVPRILPCYCVFDTALFVPSITRMNLNMIKNLQQFFFLPSFS